LRCVLANRSDNTGQFEVALADWCPMESENCI
jgi:hypothetical protein